MLKNLLAAIGATPAVSERTVPAGLYKPYAESHANLLYNLLFCDDIGLFRAQASGNGADPWATLHAEEPDKIALLKMANDQTNEGRVRALAYGRLRALGETVPPKQLLGVIVEVPLEQGLDVLAAFSDGGVRYLNQSGKIAIFEGPGNPVEGLAKTIIAISQSLVNEIGPWDRQRLAPPKTGNVRLTFLVSDGLYFGEGPFGSLQKDAMAGPILAKATQLLQRVVTA